MRLLFVIVVALALAPGARSQDAPPSLEQLIAKLGEIRKQKADLDRQEAAVAADLRARFKDLHDQLSKLGLLDPGPKPPPAPVDPLKARLKAAFDAGAGTADQRREWAKDLALLYRKSATLSADARIVTAADLKNKIVEAARELLREAPIKDPLLEVRRVVAAELSAVLPTNTDLTDEQRMGAAALFTRLATHLEALTRE